MKILAIETATDACSVALCVESRIVDRQTCEPRVHAERVLRMVRDCLEEADLSLGALDSLAFGRGPGSFTGVRIAAGIVQGLALGADLPVVPVSTLAGHAVAAWRKDNARQVAVAVDARMDECYWGCFRISETGVASLVGKEMIAKPGAVPPPGEGDWVGVGSGWQAFPELRSAMPAVDVRSESILPMARDIVPTAIRKFERGEAVPAEQALPVYLREKVAWRGGSSKK
jgi:tRNA threonylcarbamoyladenosine biosynthesis protein TsaB